jgi:hypothetical protein
MVLSWTSRARSVRAMSSDPIPEDEHPEIDDGTLSEVIRKPTRTAGDLSEVADGLAAITTEEVVRDLESVASRPPTSTDRELLEDLIRRVERIEQHVGIESTDTDDDGLHEVSKVVKAADLDDPDISSADVLRSTPSEVLSDEDADQHPRADDTTLQEPYPRDQYGGSYSGPGT